MFWKRKSETKTKEKRRRKKRRRRKRHSSKEATLERFVVEEIELADDAAPVGPASSTRELPKPPPAWLPALKMGTGWAGLWSIIMAASLVTRSVWPPDETRMLAVAWEMWQRGDWLIPHLNGNPYPNQPPLLPWLVAGGWKLFGVNTWWPRLVPALFALFSLGLTGRLAHHLWPGQQDVVRYAPLVLLGTGFWALYQTMALPEMLTVFFTLLAMLALVLAWRGHGSAWLLLGLSMGLGVLAGGPVILVYSLPVILLAPLWVGSEADLSWGRWYGDVIRAGVFATAIVMVWLVPAMDATGNWYLDALMRAAMPHSVELFYLAGPWWWYLFLLPFVLLPWSVWPLGWMRLWHIRRERLDAGIVFCMAWSVPVIIILSFFSLRQPQLLLPILPAYALAMAYLLLDEDLVSQGEDSFFASMVFPVIALGGVLAVLPGLPRVDFLPGFLWELSPFIGVSVAALGIAVAWLPQIAIQRRIAGVSVTTMFLVVLALFAVGYQFDARNQIKDIAQVLAAAEYKQWPIAHVAPYEGQYHFAGRLKRPLVVLTGAEVGNWAAHYPQGMLITYADQWQPRPRRSIEPLFEFPYRNTAIRLWEASAIGT